MSSYKVRGAGANLGVRIIGAAVRSGCRRGLIGDVTAGRLERRRAISASSSAILALAAV